MFCGQLQPLVPVLFHVIQLPWNKSNRNNIDIRTLSPLFGLGSKQFLVQHCDERIKFFLVDGMIKPERQDWEEGKPKRWIGR